MKLPEGTSPFVYALLSAVVGTELVLLQHIPVSVSWLTLPPVSVTVPVAVAHAVVPFWPGDVTLAPVDTTGKDGSVVKLTCVPYEVPMLLVA